MFDKFKDIYRIPSARLKGKDYSYSGWYYLTICTANKECLFGEILNGEMHLSSIGEIVKQEFERSFEIRSELLLDKYVIMPDHLHAIVVIKFSDRKNNSGLIDADRNIIDSHGNIVNSDGNIIDVYNSGKMHDVETHDFEMHSVETQDCETHNEETHGRASLRDVVAQHPDSSKQTSCVDKATQMPQRTSKSISSFVAGFKSIATKRINELRGTPRLPVWQTRFYDVIIRNDQQLYAVRKYIEENPMNWRPGEKDEDFY